MKKITTLKCGIKLSYRLSKNGGVYIISCTEIKGEEKTTEKVSFVGARKRAKQILSILAKNDVFPCHLNDVITELMC